jgi:hydroxyacylglutathione hydrolase
MAFRVLTQRNAEWRSNSYLVVDPGTGHAAFVDCGDPVDHLLAVIGNEGLTLERVLLTHHHGDHISGLGHVLEAYPGTPVQAHPDESNQMMGVSQTILPGDLTEIGNLEVTALGTPGHTSGMLNFLVRQAEGDEGPEAVFTGDTLFRSSVGSLQEPGATTFADLRHSVVDVLLELPPATVIYPGHEEPTTIAGERHENPFVQHWLGRAPSLDRPAVVRATPDAEPRAATIVVWADDFDGGYKAQVRYADDGTDDLVPGSWVAPA